MSERIYRLAGGLLAASPQLSAESPLRLAVFIVERIGDMTGRQALRALEKALDGEPHAQAH